MKRINQMLLEMASGNFFYRLERSGKNDNLEAIGLSLNMLAEEIQETLLHQGYANTNSPIAAIVQMSFVVDKDGFIDIANQQACNMLSVLQMDIIGHPFSDFLIEKSRISWKEAWRSLKQSKFQDRSLELTFKSKGSLVIPKTCYMTSLNGKQNDFKKALITVIHHSNRQDHLENDLKQRVIQHSNDQQSSNNTRSENQKQKLRLSFEDIRRIREAHSIIINNLEKDFPSLKKFALQLGTNEFKLKYGFKELYGTTVYRFLKEERLRKAKMMIQYTRQTFKSIAEMTGFKSNPHFTRTFKKRYGYTPRDLRKKTLNPDKKQVHKPHFNK
ncbi:AraC family transcriptional regulator [Changchengzhania lutea]|uniref:AraC family transcriptional regulator n=1 Tax=Changchengzhania lutea TaxID=2049305 RepID=UPI00115F1C0F|nr:helix-turn-helix domain-containing protein [Changchengzhania lutea]